jgi:hypothetical protein
VLKTVFNAINIRYLLYKHLEDRFYSLLNPQ